MLREFCTIAESSVYFGTAERQLERWIELYPDDLHAAQDTLLAEGMSACPIEEAISAFKSPNLQPLETKTLNPPLFSDALEVYQSVTTK